MLETLIQFFVDWGYWGMFLAAFAAGSILPLGSEVVFVLLLRMGLDPMGCLLTATAGNTLGGMTCYWIGHLGKKEWICRLGVSEERLDKACRFLGGRGAIMGFFAFLPYIGEALAIVLGLMRSNIWLTTASMCVGKLLRYFVLLWTFEGLANLF